jgi:colanic acid biosynthesis glycosyl transferase WcaI
MRICLITEYFYPDNLGGGGPLLSQLIRSLRDTHTDWEVDVITSRHLYRMESEPLAAQEDWDGVKITRLNTPKPSGRSTAWRLAANVQFSITALLRLLSRRRYDMTLVATAPLTVPLAAYTYKRLTGTPYLYIIHDLQPDLAVGMRLSTEGHPIAKAMRRLQRCWLHEAGKVAVLGRCMRDYLMQRYDLPAERVEVIPVGEDPERVMPSGKQSRFRTQHGLDGFMVLYGGNFGRYHNFDTILDAAKHLQSIGSSITFVLAGGGAQKDRIERRVTQEAIKNVRVFDYIRNEEYLEVLASADAALVTLEPGMEGLCVPSKFYGILAAGVPSVALVSPVSEIGRVIAESHCGVQLDQGDTQGLIETLAYLSNSPEHTAQMGRNARSVLVKHYTSHSVMEQYTEAMQSIVSEKDSQRGTSKRRVHTPAGSSR